MDDTSFHTPSNSPPYAHSPLVNAHLHFSRCQLGIPQTRTPSSFSFLNEVELIDVSCKSICQTGDLCESAPPMLCNLDCPTIFLPSIPDLMALIARHRTPLSRFDLVRSLMFIVPQHSVAYGTLLPKITQLSILAHCLSQTVLFGQPPALNLVSIRPSAHSLILIYQILLFFIE